MSEFTHEGTEDLQNLADEVERERQEKGSTPFDDTATAEDEDGTTREDHDGVIDVMGVGEKPARAGTVGAAGLVQRPGV
ncbi:MAG: hypothetical protein ACK4MD_06550 [Demequina sp.]